tara:strand:+ start:277 stop:432 length:156 start_codon:yes stop_codon:yes gene_type:complete
MHGDVTVNALLFAVSEDLPQFCAAHHPKLVLYVEVGDGGLALLQFFKRSDD